MDSQNYTLLQLISDKLKIYIALCILLISVAGLAFSLGTAGAATQIALTDSQKAKLSPELQEIYLNPANSENEIKLITYLSGAPENLYIEAAEKADKKYSQILTLSNEVKEKQRKNNLDASSLAAYKEQIETLRKERATYVTQLLHEALDMLQENAKTKISSIPETLISQKDLILNSFAIKTKVKNLPALAALGEIQRIEIDAEGRQPLDNSPAYIYVKSPFVGAPSVWNQGVHGEGQNVLQIDTGVYTSHPHFSGLNIQSNAFGGCDPTVDEYDHGTHTASVIAGQDSVYKGVSYGIETLYNAKSCNYFWTEFEDAYMWAGLGGTLNDAESVVWEIEIDGGAKNGVSVYSSYVDNVTALYGSIQSIPAGNTNYCGDGLITQPSDAYNVIAVGNMNDNSSAIRNNHKKDNGSCMGPATGPDGTGQRIKPDIMAPGTNTMSANASGGISNFGGTSAAGPHIAGTVALLLQASAGSLDSRGVRALLLNTAEDWSPTAAGASNNGPDNDTGFGYADANKAYLNWQNVYAGNLQQGKSKLYSLVGAQQYDRITLVYDRHYIPASPYYRISDLDLHLYKADSTPYLDTTFFPSWETRKYARFTDSIPPSQIIIKAKATTLDAGITTEPFSMATNGSVIELTAPTINPQITVPSFPVYENQIFGISAKITNNGNFTINNANATLILDSGMSFVNSAQTQSCVPSSVNPSGECNVTWQVKVNAGGYGTGTKTIAVNTQAEAFEEIFSGTAQNLIQVKIDPLAPVLETPENNYSYKVCAFLHFSWTGAKGSDGYYWFNPKYNGALMFDNPAGPDGIKLKNNYLNFAPYEVDSTFDDGNYEWQVCIVDNNLPPGIVHCSQWRTIAKNTKPKLLRISPNQKIKSGHKFNWMNVPNAKTYVVKFTGNINGFNYTPSNPFYYLFGSASPHTITLSEYGMFTGPVGSTYTWALAAVCNGSPALEEMAKYEYSGAKTFYKG